MIFNIPWNYEEWHVVLRKRNYEKQYRPETYSSSSDLLPLLSEAAVTKTLQNLLAITR